MKEFKYCHEEITMGVEIPVTVCETQKEMVKIISEYRKECKWGTADEYTVIWVIYKDGSTFYHAFNDGEAEGKFKRTGIERAVISTSWEFIVFGDFSIIDNGSISIDESDIEEYGVYAGQYDVKEQEAQEVQETVEQTTEVETKMEEMAETEEYDSGFEYYSVETAYEVDFRDRQNEVFKSYSEAEKTAGDNIILEVDLIVRNDKKAVSEHDKEVFEDETDEIECRCIWYHHNGVKGMIAQDTKRVIKKPETAEVSKEVVDNRKEVNSTSFIQQLYDAEYSKTLTVQGGIERFLKLAI